jgi:hypothetical protein
MRSRRRPGIECLITCSHELHCVVAKYERGQKALGTRHQELGTKHKKKESELRFQISVFSFCVLFPDT